MLDGSLKRFTLIAVLLLTVPVAAQAAPTPGGDGATSTGDLEITDLALAPGGRFGIVVVQAPATDDPLPGLGGLVKKTPTVYTCDFGPVDRSNAGTGCHGLNHSSRQPSSAATSRRQSVDASLVPGQPTRYAVGGPGDLLSLWTSIQDSPVWEINVPGEQNVLNVTITPDGGRIVAGTSPASPTEPSRLVVYEATTGGPIYKWEYNLTDGSGNRAGVRLRAMDQADKTDLLVVGTTSGVLFFRPGGGLPGGVAQTSPVDTAYPVTHVALADDGSAAVVGTTRSVYFIPLQDGRPVGLPWHRELPNANGASAVAISGDGSRFAVGSGNRVSFYRALDDSSLVAEGVGEAYDTGFAVRDLAYADDARLLVALAGNRAYGFAASSTSPIWTFDATAADGGGLDGPLGFVDISEGAERILIGGKARFRPYSSTSGASVSYVGNDRVSLLPGSTQTLQAQVTNTGSLAEEFVFLWRVPAGWSGVRSPEGATLSPDASTLVNVTLAVPEGQPPGTYAASLEVRLPGATSGLATGSLEIVVPRAVTLALETADERLQIRQGVEEVVPVVVRNTGNAEGLVNLTFEQDVEGGGSWSVSFSENQVRIGPGGEAEVELTVRPPAAAPSGEKNVLTLRAWEGNREVTRTLVAYVDPDFGAELSAQTSLPFRPGETKVVPVTVRNTGNTDDTFSLTAVVNSQAADDWSVTLDHEELSIPQGQSRSVNLTIRPTVAEPREGSLTVRALSQESFAGDDGSIVLSLYRQQDAGPGDEDTPAPGLLPVLVGAITAALLARRLRGGPR